ncbi:NOC3p-domain-containing protein [Marasmius fiardii PR-910]|nr:NOC3p-domain-containing protein [Marasmius fiardii PR-910]
MVKRPGSHLQGSRKKPKLATNKSQRAHRKPNEKDKGKERAADRDIIQIPTPNGEDGDEDEAISDQDLDVLVQYGNTASFLGSLDRKGISRSKKETQRLHHLNKPVRKARVDHDLPSIDSHDEDDREWSSNIGSEEEGDVHYLSSEPVDSDSDTEMPYEIAPRKIRTESKQQENIIQRLPIKLADGTVQSTGWRAAQQEDEDAQDEEEEEEDSEDLPPPRDTVATGARFGRAAVIDVISTKSRKGRIQAAKEQIAGICQDIVAEPENSLGLLKRLHTFSLPSISSPTHPDLVPNDPIIRKLSILSQLAVFKDIVPGYRIRALTEKEKAEKVSQVVARTREWEQGLVGAYQTYLRLLEGELKTRSDLSETTLRCICTLLTELTHFNFRANLMSCVVAQLSKKTRNDSFDLCLATLIRVLKADSTGTASLEIVRLLNRMIKEKRYNVHPAAISCLLYLRLKTELGGVRSSDTKASKEQTQDGKKTRAKKKKGKDEAHLSKKAVKALKERREIEKEFKEAEAEVDKEERANIHTETLKLVFVLYFSILKNPGSKRLLPVALEGIAKFAHLVNIDFFRDLMKVLKELIVTEGRQENDEQGVEGVEETKLLCIVTAFELLSGQGEALTVDLSDFTTQLYALIPSLILCPLSSSSPQIQDTLLRVLNLVFLPRHTHSKPHPTYRTAAFSKRLLTACLHLPSPFTLNVLEFIRNLVTRDPQLLSLIGGDEDGDGPGGGLYNAIVDNPELANALNGKGGKWYELCLLRDRHWDGKVREGASRVLKMGGGRS